MERKIVYREIKKGEEEKTCLLVMKCFNEFVAPSCSQEGIMVFSKYADPAAMQQRLAKNHFVILALDEEVLAGMIEVRNNNHISLFFVSKEYQNRGIGRKLHKLSIEKCRQFICDISAVDVNSSLYAVPIYEKLGFVKVNNEETINGIRFTRMAFKLG